MKQVLDSNTTTPSKEFGYPCTQTLYFLEWTKSAFHACRLVVKEIYLNPLNEHCNNRKSSDKEKKQESSRHHSDAKDEKEKLANPHDRFRDAIAKMSYWDDDNRSCFMVSNKSVAFAELAVCYRLSSLLKLSGQLIEILERLLDWLAKNSAVISGSKDKTEESISYAVTMFNCVCSFAEIFRLTSIQSQNCKPSFKKYLNGTTTYIKKENSKFKISDVNSYIPRMEARINYFRTIVYMLGSYLISIIQTCLRVVKPEQLEVKVREVQEILSKLPPMYLRVKKLELSKETVELLKDPPPNKRTWSLVPKASADISQNTSRHDAQNVGQEVMKAYQKKYRNPINEEVGEKEKNNESKLGRKKSGRSLSISPQSSKATHSCQSSSLSLNA